MISALHFYNERENWNWHRYESDRYFVDGIVYVWNESVNPLFGYSIDPQWIIGVCARHRSVPIEMIAEFILCEIDIVGISIS